MPNAGNVDSPIILISAGRSGTSLVLNLLDQHPDVSSVGETANFIFHIWSGVEVSAGITSATFEHGQPVSFDERAARCVRQAFLTCFHGQTKRWFQKPIGVPLAMSWKFGSDWEGAAQWYWRVLRTCFPKAVYLTILRHPCDVVLSSCAYWGTSQSSAWRGLGCLASILTHPSSPVRYAIHYEQLVREPEPQVRRLFEYLELDVRPEVFRSFEKVHAAAPGRDKLERGAGSTRQDNWSQLEPTMTSPDYLRLINQLHEKFGHVVDWPEHLAIENVERAQVPEPLDKDELINKLRDNISSLNNRLYAQSIERVKRDAEIRQELKAEYRRPPLPSRILKALRNRWRSRNSDKTVGSI